MRNNKLIIAGAGSGKTTLLVTEAAKGDTEKILITTYTEANAEEIKNKFIKNYKFVPSHIKIQTWFSFLIQHGVRPYQGTFNNLMFTKRITGLDLVSTKSAGKYGPDGKQIVYNGHPLYWPESDFEKHYFNNQLKIYSDKLSKFVFHSNSVSNGEVIKRISRIYSCIYIDEVQDLAGYDLEIIKLLFKSPSSVTLVGDPRQVTYLTHSESKNHKYSDGKIKDYLEEKCKSLIIGNIDDTTLSVSHRNNQEICDYSNILYPRLPKVEPCKCTKCRSENPEHVGIFIVSINDKDTYINKYKPVQLRWNAKVITDSNYDVLNFGESKGRTLDRVIIYPTEDMKKWVIDNNFALKNETRAKLYVAITRARFSVAIVMDINNDFNGKGVQKYIKDSEI